jgi:predicted unusual protein kinase regulating ubiquinone biosynthesis (AarF/ABC1/UbiB family)
MTLWLSLRRLAYITFVITKHVLAHVWGVLLAHLRPRSHVLTSGPNRLRAALEELGGSFIKFGQMLALQPDILSLEYCNGLFDLLDRITPFDYPDVEKIFVEETGKTPSEIFDSFAPVPIATASIGQVHVAYLDGRKVAVKVQRPNVETDFAGDIRLMVSAMALIKRLRISALYWLLEPLSEFVTWTREELDYRREARYMEQLRHNARDNFNERIPEVFWQYTSRRTLVCEFLEGVTVLEYLRALEAGDELLPRRLEAAGFDALTFAQNIINNFVSDAFRHGMFHADLHPANLMILPGNCIGYVDFGITAVLSRYSRQNLIAMTYALVQADTKSMGPPFFNVSVMDDASDIDAFREGLKRLEDQWYMPNGRGRALKVNITTVMLDMIKLSRQTGIWPERDVVKYIRSAVAADGLINRFAAGFNLGQHLATICNQQLSQQASASIVTYHSFVNWTTSTGHIIEDGMFRVNRFLNRVAAGELLVSDHAGAAPLRSQKALRRTGVRLAASSFVVSLLVVATGESAHLGVNMFTAAALFVAASALMLFRTIGKLA